MRILLVQRDLFSRSVGGSEFYEHHLAVELAPRHDLTIFCTNPRLGRTPLRPAKAGASPIVEVLPDKELHPFSRREREIRSAFETLVNRFSPDVVHVQDLIRLSPEIPGIAQRHGTPVLHSVHDYFLICPRVILRTTRDELCPGPSPSGCARCGRDMARERYRSHDGRSAVDRSKMLVKSFLQRRATETYFALARRRRFLAAANNCNLVLCASTYLRGRLRDAGIPEEGLRVLPYGLPDLGPVLEKSPSERLRVGFVGTLARHKGIFVLLAAARLCPDVVFELHGPLPPDVAPQVKAKIDELPNVRWNGVLRDGDKSEAYTRIDVLAVPSVWHESGRVLSLLEALRFRTPVIGSRLGGIEEALRDGGGWLLPAGDAGALADCVRDLAANREKIAAEVGRIPTIESMAEHARKVESFYEEARSLKRPR